MIFDAGKILTGLAAFTGLLTAPVWAGLAGGNDGAQPTLVVGTKESNCVLPREQMRATHMEVLNEWRDRVVRRGERVTRTAEGKELRMSLTGTCLGCHADKAQFCDRCHEYAAVEPTCFNCHEAPSVGAR